METTLKNLKKDYLNAWKVFFVVGKNGSHGISLTFAKASYDTYNRRVWYQNQTIYSIPCHKDVDAWTKSPKNEYVLQTEEQFKRIIRWLFS